MGGNVMGGVRKTIFWIHLGIGLLAGALVMLMSITGVLLAFERQITEMADGFNPTLPANSSPLGPESLLEKVRGLQQPPSAIGFERDPSKPLFYQYGKDRTVFADPRTGESLGSGNVTVRGFFKSVLSWHRWLGREGAAQAQGRAIIGIGNLLFLVLLATGVFLWFPKRWTRSGVKAVTLLQRRLRGRARDWNRHHTFGFWASIPLLVIVICGTVISQPWANAMVFQLAGEAPPPQGAKRKPAPFTMPEKLTGLDAAFAAVKVASPDWRNIQLQLPFDRSATFAVSDSHRGRPDKRRQLTVDLTNSSIIKTEGFGDLSPARRTRSWIRWIHTGEAGGIAGQSVAGLAAASSAVLVWTGFALSWRRFTRKHVV